MFLRIDQSRGLNSSVRAFALLIAIVSVSPIVWPNSAVKGSYPSAPNNLTAPIQTNSPFYQIQRTRRGYAVSIPLVYTNKTGKRIYIPTRDGTYPPVLEKWVKGAWVTAYAQVVVMYKGLPIVINPGEEYQYVFEIEAARTGSNAGPQFEVAEIPGSYRLVWTWTYSIWPPDFAKPRAEREPPLEARVSNTFVITE